MTVIGIPLEQALHSPGCPATWRGRRAHSAQQGRDYCLVDDQGRRLGIVAGANREPVFGKNAPTILLNREWGR
ncbi:MAG: hypothetical protein GTN62_02875 [Gemmatimonadales bacterium]|nr:hypothetical protein [Gemmatimonadales bacterium]NIN10247.1 hypothetical protein [Gemmatimonadales bacterium]NIN49043.1 hypothetical protein [Gemmatimonadales bacterium]NIP06507.1 hypothetical protein [Gemmatimonadales bacterium]NIQ98850.1 hypothetical protein [Gemmatimonadales bacterium]